MTTPRSPRSSLMGARYPIVLALLLALASVPIGGTTAAQERDGPATGRAQVIAQGVAQLPSVPVAWRAIAADAAPPAEAPVAERSLGFVVGDVAPFVITSESDGSQQRLASGEGAFVAQGTRQQRTGLPEQPVGYYGLELVVAPDVSAGYSLGSAVLLGTSDPFAAPPGRRDLDLTRDILAPGERGVVPDFGAPALILVTDGAVRVQSDTGATQTIRTDEAASLSGELTLTAGDEGATLLTATIGPEVTNNLPVAPPPPPVVVETGTIAVTPYTCPAGMRPQTLNAAECSPAPEAMALQTFVLGSGDNYRSLADASFENGAYVWAGLPFGDYLVQATVLLDGYDRYFIPGLDGINSPPAAGYTTGPNEGYVAPLNGSQALYRLDVYAFPRQVSAEPTTSLSLTVNACAPGIVAMPDMRQADCGLVDPFAMGFDLRLAGDLIAEPLTLADSRPNGAGGWTWDGLPNGSYTISATLPPGYDGYALRSYLEALVVTPLPDFTGYSFAINQNLFAPGETDRSATIEAYLLIDR